VKIIKRHDFKKLDGKRPNNENPLEAATGTCKPHDDNK